VAVFGSWATGGARHDSDLDLAIYHDGRRPPAVRDLRWAAQSVDKHAKLVTPVRISGSPWVAGGCWLEIEGHAVQWIYRNLDHIGRQIEAAKRGIISSHYHPAHADALHAHALMAEVTRCIILHDPSLCLETLRDGCMHYPEPLRQAILTRQRAVAELNLDLCEVAVDSTDWFYATGCLYRAAAAIIQCLYAVNRAYYLNEKTAIRELRTLQFVPPQTSSLLAEMCTGGRRLEVYRQLLANILDEVQYSARTAPS
jgi:hypothetical protein